jgi:hypothetical protein
VGTGLLNIEFASKIISSGNVGKPLEKGSLLIVLKEVVFNTLNKPLNELILGSFSLNCSPVSFIF